MAKKGGKSGMLMTAVSYFLLTVILAGGSGCGKSPEEPGSRAVAVDSENNPGNRGTEPDREESGGNQATEPDREESGGNRGTEAGVGTETGGGVPGAAGETKEAAEAVTDFGLRLLQQCMTVGESAPQEWQQGNQVISPLSVLSALAMTGNGAGGETLEQMEETFGITIPELSAFLSGLRADQAMGDETCRLNMANGIWFTADERFRVEEEFLRKCSDSFGAEGRRVSFDNTALEEINGWVKENTEGMIEEILDDILPDAVMYLVNALAFDGEWEEIYREEQVREGEFTQADGTVQKAEMMYSQEEWYLQDEHESGFLKYYAGRKYAYAALLPEEGMDVREYVASLNGEKLRRILANPTQAQVQARIPKYVSEYGAELENYLQLLGMRDAFDPGRADFSGIGFSQEGNLYISRVLHKVFIAVDERGTRAGASTAVEIKDESALEIEIRTVYLDRPFVYLILDCESGTPVFMGILTRID